MSENEYLAYQRAVTEGRLASQRDGHVPAYRQAQRRDHLGA